MRVAIDDRYLLITGRRVETVRFRRGSFIQKEIAYGSFAKRLHLPVAVDFLGESMDSASLWTTLFNCAGADMLSPYLDSRIVRLALNLPPHVRFRFRRPKDLLKRALAQLAPAELAYRTKLSFGQPIF